MNLLPATFGSCVISYYRFCINFSEDIVLRCFFVCTAVLQEEMFKKFRKQ